MTHAGEALDLGQVLLDLLVVVVAARIAAEVAERIRVPAVLGEIIVGILIGPSVLGWIDTARADTSSMLLLIGEIGVLLLLLQVGMEMDLAELARVGPAALAVAIVGVAVPFVGGALGAWGMGEVAETAIFLGAALTATSVGITARVLGDLKALSTTEARVVLGAAVADDVLGLIILTVVVKVVTEGSVSAGTVAQTIGMAIGFLLLTGLIGVLVVPKAFDAIARWSRAPGALLIATIALMLAFALLADAAKLAFIIGAFMAGLGVGRSHHVHRIEDGVISVSRIFIPVFFVSIGVNADLEAMARPSVLGLAAVLSTIGIVGKLLSGWAAIGTTSDRLLVGIGMIPRGEVGLIFASIGLARGVLDDDLYGALLIMILVTTVIAPPLLRWRIQSLDLPLTGGSYAVIAASALIDGRTGAATQLAAATDLRSTLPAVAAIVDHLQADGVGSGRTMSFNRLDAIGAGSPLTLRRAAFVVDVVTASETDDVEIDMLTAAIAPDEDGVVASIARATLDILDVAASPDGVSRHEIDRLLRQTNDVTHLEFARHIATATPELDLVSRASIDALVDAALDQIG